MNSEFSPYVVDYRDRGVFLQTKFLSKKPQDCPVLFSSEYTAKSISLAETFYGSGLNSFIERHLSPQQQTQLKQFFDSVRLPKTAAHGDFHRHNLFTDADKIQLIDWEFYSEDSSWVLDKIDFEVMAQAGQDPWYVGYQRLLKSQIATLESLNINRRQVVGFAFWKVSKDIFQLDNLYGSWWPEGKSRKYVRILLGLSEDVANHS